MKYKAVCVFCGNAREFIAEGRVLKVRRCEKCGGFMRISAEEFEVSQSKGEK